MSKAKVAGKQPIHFEAKKDQMYAWCTCGASESQPFCNGKHQGSDFSPMIVKENESKSVYLCTCKQSSNPPYCDGSHARL